MTKFLVTKKMYIGLIALLIIVSIPTGVYAYNIYSYNKILKSAELSLEKENFDEAIIKYTKALTYRTEATFINEKISIAKRQQNSKEYFDEATHLFEQKEFVKAIETFRKVDALDIKYYKKAQEVIDQYRNDNLNKAKQEAINQNYTVAINYLDIILEFDPSSSEATTLKDQYSKELARIAEAQKKLEAEKKALEQTANRLASEKTTQKQATEKVPSQSSTIPGRPAPKTISTSGPFTLSQLDVVLSNGHRGFRFFITGPRDSSGCEITGAAQSDLKLVLYNGSMPDDGFTNIGILIQDRDTPPGKYAIVFSIKYKNKEYSLGGSVTIQ